MERQVSKKPVPYILKEDRSEPPEKQVIFGIRPLKGDEAAELVSLYAEVTRTGKRGQTEVDKKKLKKAEEQAWLRAVAWIKNYPPSEDFPELLELCNDKGRIEYTDDPDVLLLIYRDLLADQVQEILDARGNLSHLTEAEKKST